MVAIPAAERADFEDLLGSGGLFRKTLRASPEGAQAGAPNRAPDRLRAALTLTGCVLCPFVFANCQSSARR